MGEVVSTKIREMQLVLSYIVTSLSSSKSYIVVSHTPERIDLIVFLNEFILMIKCNVLGMQLGFRLSHILRRSLPIAFYLQQASFPDSAYY